MTKAIVISFIIFIILFWFNLPCCKNKYNLEKDGFTIINQILSNDDLIEINKMVKDNKIKDIKTFIIQNNKIKNKLDNVINSKYLFHDYIFYIKKSKIHTCHRDYNGTLFNSKVKNPSYTIIFFLNDMNSGLDVIPGSHTSIFNNAINLLDVTQGIPVLKGDAIIFNANLIHSGAFNDQENNPRIQMKLSHPDDIETYNYYNKYNKILDKDNSSNKYFQQIQKYVSCQFPIFSDLTNYDAKKNIMDKSFGKSWGEQFVSLFFYGDKDFYDLKEAFISIFS